MRITFTYRNDPVDTISGGRLNLKLSPALADVLDRFQCPIGWSKVAAHRPLKHLHHERKQGSSEGGVPTALG